MKRFFFVPLITMNKYLNLIFLSIYLLCFTTVTAMEKYVVINPEGAKVYEQPKFDAKVIAILNFGDTIIKKKSNVLKERYFASNDIILNGYWIKVKVKNKDAYTFSVHYSNKLSITGIDGKGNPSINLLGAFLRSTNDTVIIELTNSNTTYETDQLTKWYEHGKSIETQLDGCKDYSYTYEDATLNEVYFKQVLDHFFKTQNGQIIPPVSNKQSEERVEFGDLEATIDLTIQSIGVDKYVVSYYSCD